MKFCKRKPKWNNFSFCSQLCSKWLSHLISFHTLWTLWVVSQNVMWCSFTSLRIISIISIWHMIWIHNKLQLWSINENFISIVKSCCGKNQYWAYTKKIDMLHLLSKINSKCCITFSSILTQIDDDTQNVQCTFYYTFIKMWKIVQLVVAVMTWHCYIQWFINTVNIKRERIRHFCKTTSFVNPFQCPKDLFPLV